MHTTLQQKSYLRKEYKLTSDMKRNVLNIHKPFNICYVMFQNSPD